MLSYNRLARWLGLPGLSQDCTIHGVKIDSRQIEPGDLFIALKGKHQDGNQFVHQAVSRGAIAVMSDQPIKLTVPLLQVNNPLQRLCDIAKQVRDIVDPIVIAITGSCGKTTVKHFVHTILADALGPEKVMRSPGNFNSLTGVPLSMLQLRPSHRYAILEMGMNCFGEIAQNSQLARPDIAAIHAIAAVHTEHVGTLEGVAKAKSEVFTGLKPKGIAIINTDLPYFPTLCQTLQPTQRLWTFGQIQKNSPQRKDYPDLQISHIVSDFEHCHFRLTLAEEIYKIHLPLPGAHQATNAACAAAMTYQLGLPLAKIAQSLNHLSGVTQRLQRLSGKAGAILIDDSYNASPRAVHAAIDVLSKFSGQKILLLGAMHELGAQTLAYHDEVGRYAKAKGIDYLYTLGEATKASVTAFGNGAKWYPDFEALVEATLPHLNENTAVLIKGSRCMKMERVVSALQT